LNREPTERLGNNGSEEIKAHPFFGGIDWVKLYNKKYQPPFKPSVVCFISVLMMLFKIIINILMLY